MVMRRLPMMENQNRSKKNMEEALTNPLGEEKINKLLRQFAIPSIVSMLVGSLYNIVDQIFIGWSEVGAY